MGRCAFRVYLFRPLDLNFFYAADFALSAFIRFKEAMSLLARCAHSMSTITCYSREASSPNGPRALPSGQVLCFGRARSVLTSSVPFWRGSLFHKGASRARLGQGYTGGAVINGTHVETKIALFGIFREISLPL